MKRLIVWIVSTAGGVALLFSYHTSTSGAGGGKVVAGVAPVGVVPEPSPAAPSLTPGAAAPPAPTATEAAAPSPPARKTPVATTRTINGAPIDTRYGPVQVQITVRGSRILSADAIAYPQGERRDLEINSQAVPQLDHETLRAQSARIDTVSGATYTSDGYRASLQSALDAAHL